MSLLILGLILIIIFPSSSFGKELPKVAVWDLVPREVKPTYAQELTSILVSEISKMKQYEVYSQENVRTLAGWTEERMKLGCTNTQCLTALGQMEITKLISGSVGKIGNRYSVSLNLFDTQNAKAELSISEFCRSEDELIELVQVAVRKLLGEDQTASPSPTPPTIPQSTGPASVIDRLGVTARPVTMEEAKQYGMPSPKGVVIVAIEPNSPLGEAGVKEKDIILQANRIPIQSIDDFSMTVKSLKPGEKIQYVIRRGRTSMFVVFVGTRVR